jgi:hypothetical protein
MHVSSACIDSEVDWSVRRPVHRSVANLLVPSSPQALTSHAMKPHTSVSFPLSKEVSKLNCRSAILTCATDARLLGVHRLGGGLERPEAGASLGGQPAGAIITSGSDLSRDEAPY